MITKTENYMPRFPISPDAPCALASSFTTVQHCLEMLVHYPVTLSYKQVQYMLIHEFFSVMSGYVRLTIDDFTAYPQVNVLQHAVRSQS